MEPSNLYNHFGGLKNVQCVFQDINKPALSSTCMYFEMTHYSRLPSVSKCVTEDEAHQCINDCEISFGIK